MKILFVYKSYYPETRGGVEEVLRVLMAGLVERGHQCTLLVTTKNKKAYTRQEGKVVIHYCPANITFSSCPMSLDFIGKFKALSRQHDMVNFNFPWPWADLTALLVGLHKPYIVTYQSDIVRQKHLNKFYKPLMHFFLRRATAIVATSERYRQSSTVLGLYPHKTCVIPLGLQDGIRLEDCLQEHTFWKDKVGEGFFLFLGVLRYYKGLSYLLEAVKNTSLPVVIAGNGPEEEKLKKIVEQHQLHNVTFLGSVNEQDKTALFSLCKAVVVPASERSEAYCLTLVEGLRAGKALISTELGTGTSFVNDAGVTGLVVPAKDAQALRTALLFLEKNSDKCKEFSKAARQRFLDHFQSEDMVKAYEDLFKKKERQMLKMKTVLHVGISKIKKLMLFILRFAFRLQRRFVQLLFINPKIGQFIYKKLKSYPNVYKIYRWARQYISFLDMQYTIMNSLKHGGELPSLSEGNGVKHGVLYSSILHSMLNRVGISLNILKIEQLRATDHLAWIEGEDVDENIKCIFYAYLRRLPSEEDIRFYAYISRKKKSYMPMILSIKSSIEFSRAGLIKVAL